LLNKQIAIARLSEWQLPWPSITPDALATFVLAFSFTLLAVMEFRAPKQKIAKRWLQQSYTTNFSLFIFNSLIMSLLSASTLWIVAKHNVNQGLLSGLTNPIYKVLLSLLVIDLILYVWHKASHQFDSLWLFHKVHHNDPYLNISTGFRLHIIEVLITYILKGVGIILLGIDELIVLVNEVIITIFIMFHHSNITVKGEKWLGHVFVTPYLHRTHHSIERSEHDSNYGAIFSFWDRLFGTLLLKEPVGIGIKDYSPLDFVNLVKFGFTPAPPPIPLPVNLESMIAVAAYYKAEKRSFVPGRELDDWLEAKNEILQLLAYQANNPSRSALNRHHGIVNWVNAIFCHSGRESKQLQNFS
jgi:sterol desaturase/sphingolipid hydroxylase (fatty acid hydroxylase superfamily)